MPGVRPSNQVANHAAEPQVRLATVALHVAAGEILKDAAPFAEVLTPPGRVDRNREDEELLFLFDPVKGEHPEICRAVRDVVAQTYWSTAGSVTAALRRAVSFGSRHLFEHNLNVDRADRCYGGLACAVLRDRDLFLLQRH